MNKEQKNTFLKISILKYEKIKEKINSKKNLNIKKKVQKRPTFSYDCL
jgi:hypothetical protein